MATNDKALVVMTGKSRQQILEEGGTGDWALRPSVVRGFQYAICVRNSYPNFNPGPGDRSEPHQAAFLVGKILSVEHLYKENERDRYRVMFSGFAEVLVEGFWDLSRNPVRYMALDEVARRGIDLEALTFKPMPSTLSNAADPIAIPATEKAGGVTPLTLQAAKEGLAATFGVSTDAIEIIIKG
ncbi:MAG: hypothetical protein Q7T61_20995 [Caulobacter sp.]|nr:hypothetical protein [Caulobacter sp.]